MGIENHLVNALKLALKNDDTSAIESFFRRDCQSNWSSLPKSCRDFGLPTDHLFALVNGNNPDFHPWFSKRRNNALGNILLLLAAYISDYELVRFLHEKGANLASTDRRKRTALHIACERSSLEMIKFLAENSPPCIFDLHDIHGRIPLEIACLMNCTEAVQILLSQGNVVLGKGDRPVLLIALGNFKRCVMPIISLLLDAGANVDTADERGITPLLHALYLSGMDSKYLYIRENNEYIDIAMIFINHGCDVNGFPGETALHIAARNNHETLVRKLLISGADIDRRDRSGFTPLYYACKNGNQRIVDLLLICGANLRSEDWKTHFEIWRQMEILNEKNTQLLSYIFYESNQCLTLQNLCCISVRKIIRNIEEDAIHLGLPPLLVKRLQLKT